MPLYTTSEYETLYTNVRWSSWIGFFLAVLQLINMSAVKSSRRNVFVFIAVMCTVVEMVMQIVPLEMVGVQHFSAIMCDTNASFYSRYRWTDSADSVICTITGLLSTYVVLLSFWFIVPLSVEIWLRVVKGVKDVKPYQKYYFWGTLSTYVLCCLLLTFYAVSDVAEPQGSQFFCSWYPFDIDLAFYLFTLPAILYFCTAFLFTCHAIYVCVTVSLRVKDGARNPFAKIWKSYSMLILFLLIFIIVYPVMIFYYRTKLGYVDVHTYQEGAVEWFVCLFGHFKDSSDTGYITTCGEHPAVRIGVPETIFAFSIIYPLGFILFYITLTGDAKLLWRNVFMTVLQKSGFRAMAKYVNAPGSRTSYMSIVKRHSTVSSSSFADTTGEGGDTDEGAALESGIKPKFKKGEQDSIFVHMNRLLLGGRGGVYAKKGVQPAPLPLHTIAVKEKPASEVKETAREETESSYHTDSNSNNRDGPSSCKGQAGAGVGVIELFHITDVSAAVVDAAERDEEEGGGSGGPCEVAAPDGRVFTAGSIENVQL